MTDKLLTGWVALEALRECDRLYLAGDIVGRNALLLTIDPSMRYGREVI